MYFGRMLQPHKTALKTTLVAEFEAVVGKRPELQVVWNADRVHDTRHYLDALAREGPALVGTSTMRPSNGDLPSAVQARQTCGRQGRQKRHGEKTSAGEKWHRRAVDNDQIGTKIQPGEGRSSSRKEGSTGKAGKPATG